MSLFTLLPIEIRDLIVVMSGDISMINIIPGVSKKYLTENMKWTNNTLIYGPVQSGKTNKLIECLRETSGVRVLIIQNSLLVLKQYIQRLKNEKVKYCIVDSKNKIEKKEECIYILMNNCYRKKIFIRSGIIAKYVIYDEADIRYKCGIYGKRSIYCTSTPLTMKVEFSQIIFIKEDAYYKNTSSLIIKSQLDTMNHFIQQDNGLMLFTKFHLQFDMKEQAYQMSKEMKDIPIVLLCNEKFLFINGKAKKIPTLKSSINNIIDNLPKKAVIISHRMALRGLSFVSSDYKRHITHQIIKVPINNSSCLQSLRILGKFKDTSDLYLGLDNLEQFNNHLKKLSDFESLNTKNL